MSAISRDLPPNQVHPGLVRSDLRHVRAVGLDLVMHAPKFEKNRTLIDYMGGIMDSLDGSHGCEFTYLPVVYEDDCQVAVGRSQFRPSTGEFYEITIHFLPETIEGEPTPLSFPERRADASFATG